MKLIRLQIKNFRCIEDTNPTPIDQVTCFVGKNESGKTSILRALERFNSTDKNVKRVFDRERDWPRNHYENYQKDAEVLRIHFQLEKSDIDALSKEFGEGCLKTNEVEYTAVYSGSATVEIQLDDKKVKKHFFKTCGINAAEEELLKNHELSQISKAVEGKEHANLPEFSHFTPAEWLLKNSSSIDKHTALPNALDRFEEFFKKVNALIG